MIISKERGDALVQPHQAGVSRGSVDLALSALLYSYLRALARWEEDLGSSGVVSVATV